MPQSLTVYDRREWKVCIVDPGDNYGLHNALIHDGNEPLIEFWDMHHGDCGQFVSRYHLTTFMDIPEYRGLDLHGGIDVWCLDYMSVAQIQNWVKREVQWWKVPPAFTKVDFAQWSGMSAAQRHKLCWDLRK